MFIIPSILAFNIIYFSILLSNTGLHHLVFSLFPYRLIFPIWYISFSSISNSIFVCASSSALTILFYCSMITSSAWLTISFFSCCLLNFLLFAGLCPRSSVGLISVCLETKSTNTLHSYD